MPLAGLHVGALDEEASFEGPFDMKIAGVVVLRVGRPLHQLHVMRVMCVFTAPYLSVLFGGLLRGEWQDMLRDRMRGTQDRTLQLPTSQGCGFWVSAFGLGAGF